MTKISIDWWKATEIPLAEADWRNIRLYSANQSSINPFDWVRCVYAIRLAPPFAVHYGNTEKETLISPLIYLGSGSIAERWSSHREWLTELGHAIPGGRYEVWVCRPRVRNSDTAYAGLEGYLLQTFRSRTGYLPLRNRKVQSGNERHEYDEELYKQIIEADRRYLWAVWPTRGHLTDMYYA